MEEEGFGELIYYTIPGFVGGLFFGYLLDFFGYNTSALGQWFVRTLSGEGETILEGVYSINKKIKGHAASLSTVYGGKGSWIDLSLVY